MAIALALMSWLSVATELSLIRFGTARRRSDAWSTDAWIGYRLGRRKTRRHLGRRKTRRHLVGGRRAVISIDWVFRRELSASSGVASSPALRSRAAGDACDNAVGRVLINRTGRQPPANVRLKRIADFKSDIATSDEGQNEPCHSLRFMST